MRKSKKKHLNTLDTGYKLHWYQIKDILGHGGFGITYLAYDMNLDQEVAIKEYLPIKLSSRSNESHSICPLSNKHCDEYRYGLERFVKEARTIGQFKHPNIVRVRNVFEANNTAYMVMDYELGESLQEILNRRKNLPQEDIERVLYPILDGVKMIHAAGFIHRDIKPANIYIRVDGDPVLLDFGSARQSLEIKKSMTSMFSKGYAPIEQYHSNNDANEQQDQGPWTDIYSLGATVYRCLAGLAPTDAIDRGSAIIHTGKDNYVPATEIGSHAYSWSFLKAIDSALEFKRQNRPTTISDWQLCFSQTADQTTTEPSALDPDSKKFQDYLRKAQKGDIHAQSKLAYCLARGIGCKKNETEAFNLYYEAAERGHLDAQFNLGVIYAKGHGVKQNYHESFYWYERAAQQGDKIAQFAIGKMCAAGIGTALDEKTASIWYEKAAMQGSCEAQYLLAGVLYIGKGIPKDLAKAFHWYHAAAQQGHISAQLNLGYLYGKGHGVKRNDVESYQWIKKAAEGGLAKAQLNLGIIYAKGRGTEKNLQEAYQWYKLAADQGDKKAEESIKKLKKNNPNLLELT